MKRTSFLALLSLLCFLSALRSATADITYGTSATVIPIADFKSQDSPNSSTASFGNGTAFAKSDAYFVRGWVNSGTVVKSSSASYEEELTTFEFADRYGTISVGGPIQVTAQYKIGLHGQAINGGGVGLRLESGGISDDTETFVSEVSQGGSLTAFLPSWFSFIRMRINGNVSTGGNSFGFYNVAITEILYNGQVIFTGPPPIPEPSGLALIALGGLAAVPVARRRRSR
jgi:hypothetical protein